MRLHLRPATSQWPIASESERARMLLRTRQMVRYYPRQREYPHPPPPSKNNTRRIINIVDIFYLFPIRGVQIRGQAECVRAQEMEAPGSSMQQLRQANELLCVSDKPNARCACTLALGGLSSLTI